MLTLVSVREIYLGLEISRIPKLIKDGSRKKKNPVVLKTSQGFELLFGRRALQAHNGIMIKCDVLDSVTQQQRAELILAERCDSGSISPIQLGRDFLKFLEGPPKMLRRELAWRIFIRDTIIYLHIRLVSDLAKDLQDMLMEGKLSSSVAFSISALENHEGQREIAQLYLEGKLKIVSDARKLVQLVKRNPNDPLKMLIGRLGENPSEPSQDSSDEREQQFSIQDESSLDLDPKSIGDEILRLAGKLDFLSVHISEVPGYQYPILDSKLRTLENHLRTLENHLRILKSRLSNLRETLQRSI